MSKLSKPKAFVPTDEMLKTAIGRILGIVRRHNGVPNTAQRSAAIFIRSKMFRTCDIGENREEQLVTIDAALSKLIHEEQLAPRRGMIDIGPALPPMATARKPQKYGAGRLGNQSGRRLPMARPAFAGAR